MDKCIFHPYATHEGGFCWDCQKERYSSYIESIKKSLEDEKETDKEEKKDD